jgi:hypothetical protein
MRDSLEMKIKTKVADGAMEKMESSKSCVKSKLSRQPTTAGPKVPSFWQDATGPGPELMFIF